MWKANFAHGDIIMVGGYTIVVCLNTLGFHPLLCVLGAVVVCVAVGVVMEKLAYKPLRGSSPLFVLITAIVNRRDTSEVCAALTDAGFYFTRMASTGGFLTGGNSTLLIGTEEDRVPQAIAIIRQNCSRRTEKISSNVQLATPSAAYPTEVTVGGATLFVSDVTQFEKI